MCLTPDKPVAELAMGQWLINWLMVDNYGDRAIMHPKAQDTHHGNDITDVQTHLLRDTHKHGIFVEQTSIYGMDK